MDNDVINLAKSIRQTESGGDFNAKGKSGESGAYQWTPETWKSHAKEALGNENAEMTPSNQNAVAYTVIKGWKDKGLNPAQIAAKWNSGSETGWENKVGTNKAGVHYDVPKYVKSVTDAYQKIKGGGQVGADPNNPSSTANQNTANQKNGQIESGITGNETPSEAGVNAIKNTIPSALKFGKGVVESMNPVGVAKTAAQIPGEFSGLVKESGGVLPAIGNTLKEIPGQLYKGLVPRGIRSLIAGDTQGASKAFQEDPFGQAAPLVLAAEGGAKLADNVASKSAMADYVDNIGKNVAEGKSIPKPTTKYSGMFDKAVETVASPVTTPVGAIVSKAGDLTGSIARSSISQVTGLDPQTISKIISDPKEFTRLKQENTSRGGLAGEMEQAINTRIEDLSDTGKGYEMVRNSNQIAPVEPKWIDNALTDNGLTVKKGKIVADSNSITRSPSDIRAIQEFYDNWGNKKQLSPNEYLNMRSDLDALSKFDKLTGGGKTKASETIARSLREKANSGIRDKHFEELKALDDSVSPEIEFLKQAKKDLLNPDGTLKDNAASKIANASNKAQLLGRLENIMPGIGKRIEILNAVEDIQRASGVKVGTYAKGLLPIAGVSLAGVPGYLISQILTSPTMAVAILRKAGYLGSKAAPILEALKVLGGKVEKGATVSALGQGGEKSQYKGLLPQGRMQTNMPQ